MESRSTLTYQFSIGKAPAWSTVSGFFAPKMSKESRNAL